jgi:pimeloyl-ACP methyl ester carboxylesterase
MLSAVRSRSRVAWVITLVIGGVAGMTAALVTPRGPITAADALVWMAGALAVGVVSGLVIGSRWSAIVTPVVFVTVFELVRLGLGTRGPTVEGIHLGSTYGIIAFVVGRGITLLLAVPPMMLGAVLGVELATRLGWSARPGLGPIGWLVAGVVAVALTGLAVVVSRPASTAPILGSGGQRPGIAEMATLAIGGHDQVLMIRGRDTADPVVLHLAGGPGGTDIGAMRADAGLETHFVVATWDQRGTGKSYQALDPVDTLTLERAIEDTIEVTGYLRERFGQERIYLTGNSWGTLLGVHAVQRRPELYHAWIGTGQMVSPRATDVMFWEDTIAWAERVGDVTLAAKLRANGPPPYPDIRLYEAALSHEHDWNPYPAFDADRELPTTLFVPEYDLMDRVNGLRAFLDTFSVLYPQLQDIDLRQDAPGLEVPVYIVAGAHEARGRAVLAAEWFEMLEAPSKEWVVFERSGHRPSFEQPADFVDLMLRVRDETTGRSGLDEG